MRLRGVEVEREGELDDGTEATDAMEGLRERLRGMRGVRSPNSVCFLWVAEGEGGQHLHPCVGLGHCAIATRCDIAYDDLHRPPVASLVSKVGVGEFKTPSRTETEKTKEESAPRELDFAHDGSAYA